MSKSRRAKVKRRMEGGQENSYKNGYRGKDKRSWRRREEFIEGNKVKGRKDGRRGNKKKTGQG